VRSLYVRILFALFGTVLASLLAFLVTFFAMSRPGQERLIRHFQSRQIEDAVGVYQREGAPGVSAYLERLNRSLGATHYLIDVSGHDVVSGDDRSSLLHAPRRLFGGPPEIDGRLIIALPSPDGRYRLLIVAPPPFNVWAFAPYYVLILAAIALLCWLLALGIVRPLRQLAGAVDRFGRGELTTRVSTKRHDEIGNLARAFNEMAERTETLLTAERRLLQDISHELRSPLARLNIGIELARTAPDRELAVGRLQKEVDRLTGLVGSLVEVTRVEGDPSSRKSEPVRLHDIVQDVVQSCTLEAEVRRCRLVVTDTATRSLRGDPELLRRAVENVLRNAIRYAPADSEIELRAEDHGAVTVVSVRDAGRGVPDELLPRLAQPFFREDDSRDAATGGVGLGLAIAQRAVQLHHGTLLAENAHPGLRVTLTIPNQPATMSA
jgi:signal transduction histidine kinase